MGVVHEPGSQGQVEFFQEIQEPAFSIQPEMIDGEKKIRPEGGDGLQQGFDKTGLTAFKVRQGEAVGGDFKALQGGKNLSDQKIPALDKKNPGFGRGKLGIVHAPPKSGPGVQPVGHGRIVRPIETDIGRVRNHLDAGLGRGGKVGQNLLRRFPGVGVGDDDQPGIGRKAGCGQRHLQYPALEVDDNGPGRSAREGGRRAATQSETQENRYFVGSEGLVDGGLQAGLAGTAAQMPCSAGNLDEHVLKEPGVRIGDRDGGRGCLVHRASIDVENLSKGLAGHGDDAFEDAVHHVAKKL